MLQTVQMWKRLKAFQKTLGRYQQRFRKGAIASLIALALGLTSCGGGGQSSDSGPRIIKRMSEVSPPVVVQALATMNTDSQPTVSIVSPRPGSVIDNDDVSVRFRVQGLDLYKDNDLELGPHLNVLVDNEFYGVVYDTTTALELQGLTPGTHTIRAIASSAWDESFKTQEAYAQTTFHVFTKTPLTAPADDVPLLTYIQPSNTYGAEPILLDYFFTPGPSTSADAPQPTDSEQEPSVQDWQVRATVNGEPFVFDQWEPIYLKGFKPGKNWVQIELLDDNQQPIESLFNNTARIIQYEPGGDDTLSLLMRDELSIEEAGTLVDPNYSPPAPEVDEPIDVEDTIDDEGIAEEGFEAEPEAITESTDATDMGEQEETTAEIPNIDDEEIDEAEADEAEADESEASVSQDQSLDVEDDIVSDSESSEAIAPSEASEWPASVEIFPSPESMDTSDEIVTEENVTVTTDDQGLDDLDDHYTEESIEHEADEWTEPSPHDAGNIDVEGQEELSLDTPSAALESGSEMEQEPSQEDVEDAVMQ